VFVSTKMLIFNQTKNNKTHLVPRMAIFEKIQKEKNDGEKTND